MDQSPKDQNTIIYFVCNVAFVFFKYMLFEQTFFSNVLNLWCLKAQSWSSTCMVKLIPKVAQC